MTERAAGQSALLAVLLTLAGTNTWARQPPADPATAVSSADEAVESYIERLGMKRLLAEQLALRLRSAAKEQRTGLAERLGRIYVQLLTAEADAEQRRLWEQRGRDLLRDHPEADTADLRLSLNKAVYSRAEDRAERIRLRLVEPTEGRLAEQELRALEPQFTDIARRAHLRVESLERIEKSGESSEQLSAELASARRTRSLAFYYAGWCRYYIAFLSKSQTDAVEALKCFGWLLNSPNGRPASPDKLPTALLRYDHIARAALGAALASGLRGADAEAIRWLEAVDESDEVSDVIREQSVLRRISILAEAKRWADLDFYLRRLRNADRTGGGRDVRPLAPLPARLLAVLVLESDTRVARDQVEGLARIALGDLIARHEVAQVLDLVRRYGTAPIGDSGFIVFYVRGLMQYDQARTSHAAVGSLDEPCTDPAAANLYRAAARMLSAAIEQEDAQTFPTDRVRAAIMLGRSLFFAGELVDAGERFAEAWRLSAQNATPGPAADSRGPDPGAVAPDGPEEALWLAVAAMDRAARSPETVNTRAAVRRAELATLFLQTYPDSPRAARVVLIQAAAGDGQSSDEEALRILSEVPKTSPVYEAARRQVARILYARLRGSRGPDRDFAAMRFIGVSEELLASDREAALGEDRARALAASDRLVLRVRQMLEALLGGSSPDAARAQGVLDVLNAVAVFNKLDLAQHEPELTFRRIQIALATNRESEAIAMAERLASAQAASPPGSRTATSFSDAADRLIYRRIAARWSRQPGDSRADAELIVRLGFRVIGAIGEKPDSLDDPAVLALYAKVAAAATTISDPGDTPMRRRAIALDEAILRVQPRTEEALRRLAANSEAIGDIGAAIGCWSTLFSSARQASSEWFEARYESVRLLMTLDRLRAAEILEQHRRLFPDFGPPPWGERLRMLAAEAGGRPEQAERSGAPSEEPKEGGP